MATRVGKLIEAPPGGRVPPHNLEAEESVLGACLLSREAIANVLEVLSGGDFYKPAHFEIFSSILELFGRGEPVDAITVAEELRRRDTLDSIGGKPYIHTLLATVPTPGSAVHYARIVEEHALLRRLIDASHFISDLAFGIPEDVEGAVDQAEDLIYQVSQRRVSEQFIALKDLLTENMEMVEKLYEKGSHITGLATGFTELDSITAGLQTSNLIILAARPAQGKSALALSIAQHVAVAGQVPVAIFSLEMSKMELVQRLMCSEARIDSNRLRRGALSDSDWPKLSLALGRLAEAPIFIDDTANLTVMELRAKCRRLKSKHSLGLVIVDYLQLMQLPHRTENRVQEVSEISRSLKILARELDIPVIAVSQLSRNVEYRSDKRPLLADLRECVIGDTPVVLADGRRVPIRELVGSTPEVVSVSREGRLVLGRADKVWRVGKRRVLRVRLASGRTIRGTERHRLLAIGGWRRIGELQVGDRLAVARRLPEPAEAETWVDARVALLGQLIGDGSYLNNPPMLRDVRANTNVDTLPGEVFDRVRQVMRARGISRRQMAALRGVTYGGTAHFNFSPSGGMVAEYAELLDDDQLRAYATSDLFWDRVVSVKRAGQEDVYDLTVPGPSSWLADGIVSHNSGSIEQDSDLVVFIYRDEVYNPDTPQKGIAEIHIAKHRNGPIGKIELAFLDHYTKFANLARGV